MTYVKVGRMLSSLFLLKEQWESYGWRDPAYCAIQSFPQTWEGTSCDVSACCNLRPTRVETRSWREGSSHLVIPLCAFPLPHSQASLLFFSTLLSWEAGWAQESLCTQISQHVRSCFGDLITSSFFQLFQGWKLERNNSEVSDNVGIKEQGYSGYLLLGLMFKHSSLTQGANRSWLSCWGRPCFVRMTMGAESTS